MLVPAERKMSLTLGYFFLDHVKKNANKVIWFLLEKE